MRRSASFGGDRAKTALCGLPRHSRRLLRNGAQNTERSGCPAARDRNGSRNLGLTWTHGDTQRLPHMRLDFTVVDAEALHYSSAMRKAQDTAPAAAQAEKTKDNNYGKTKGGVGVTGLAMQLIGRFGPGLGCTSPEACWVQASNHQGSGKRRWTVPTGVAKTLERCSGQIHCCDNPLGHRAQGLVEECRVSCPVSFLLPFGTEPLLVNAASKTAQARDRDRVFW